MQPKITIAFYTTSGTNQTIAEIAKKAAEEAGAEVPLPKPPRKRPSTAARTGKRNLKRCRTFPSSPMTT